MKTDKSNGSNGNGGTRVVVSHNKEDQSKSALSAVSSSLPNSKKIYVAGKLHPDIRVPFREISLAPTKTMSGEVEVNEPVRAYDNSGPWGRADCDLDVTRGLPPLRRDWILNRGDVEEIDGRKIQPIDDGFLSAKHEAFKNGNGRAPIHRPAHKNNRPQ